MESLSEAVSAHPWIQPRLTAVPQLLYSEITALKWHFPQENATLHDIGKGM